MHKQTKNHISEGKVKMLEVQKSLLFKEISENRITQAIELLRLNSKLIFATNRNGRNIIHILLMKGHFDSFYELCDSIEKQPIRKILFTRSDNFAQNALHYAAIYGTPEIFESIVIDLWEQARVTATQPSEYGFTPLQLANLNPKFTDINPRHLIREKDIFLMLEEAQLNFPWHQEKLKQIYSPNFNAENFTIEFFVDYFGSNTLHCLGMHGKTQDVKAAIPLLKSHAKKLAIQVNQFGKIPLQLVQENTHKCKADVQLEIAKITINLNQEKKSIAERNSDSLKLFLDMLCTDNLDEKNKCAIIEEIKLLADEMNTYPELDGFINVSSTFKKLHNLNRQLLKNLIISVKINTLIYNLQFQSSTKENYNLLSKNDKMNVYETINAIRAKNFNQKLEQIFFQCQIHSYQISENKSKQISGAFKYQKSNCDENALIVAKLLEIMEYEPPYTMIYINKGDHVLISLSTDKQSDLNNYKNCSTNIVLLDVHHEVFYPVYYLPQKTKTRIYYPNYNSNISCSYNPNYHQINTLTFFSKDKRHLNPTFSIAFDRLSAINRTFTVLNSELDKLVNIRNLTPHILKMKVKTLRHKRSLEDIIDSLKKDYAPNENLKEKNIVQINHYINYYILALFRITQRPILPIYPKNLFSHTHWNEELRPLLTILSKIRQKIERELSDVKASYQEPLIKNSIEFSQDRTSQPVPISVTH